MNITIKETGTIWTLTEKITFRFSFIYFGLFILLQNNGAYPYLYYVLKKPLELIDSLYVWVGNNILNISYEISTQFSGSGDMTIDYISIFVIILIATIGTILWSILDRHRKNYKTLFYWITVAIRFYVGLMLVSYGFSKLFKTQFPYPSVTRLMQPYGESSPMGLAWTFLGFSKGYNIFMGVAEVAAVLLLFRKTVTIGAIITLMAAANVMAVNYFYDVPVKITSTHLVLMTLFLLTPNIKKLISLFFKGKAIQLNIMKRPNFKTKKLSLIFSIIKYVFLAYLLTLYTIYSVSRISSKDQNNPAISGLFEIEKFNLNNVELPEKSNDSVRWKKIEFHSRYSIIYKMNNKREYYTHEIDTLNSSIKLTDYYDSTKFYMLNYKKQDSLFNFDIMMNKDTINFEAINKTKKDFLLMNRGFNWINERPYNR